MLNYILTKQGTKDNLLFRKNPNWQQIEINRILDENQKLMPYKHKFYVKLVS